MKRCRLWKGALNSSGYGVRKVDGRCMLVHRLAYEQECGPIPEGLEIDHLCGIRSCYEPTHLQAVTHAENLRRGKGAKLDVKEVAAIRRASGSHVEIGRRFGVDASHVGKIKRGLAWRAAAA